MWAWLRMLSYIPCNSECISDLSTWRTCLPYKPSIRFSTPSVHLRTHHCLPSYDFAHFWTLSVYFWTPSVPMDYVEPARLLVAHCCTPLAMAVTCTSCLGGNPGRSACLQSSEYTLLHLYTVSYHHSNLESYCLLGNVQYGDCIVYTHLPGGPNYLLWFCSKL